MVLSRLAYGVRYFLTQPFRLHNTQLPSELLLIARLLAIVILLLGHKPFPLGIPYLPFLGDIPGDVWAQWSETIMLSGFVLLFFTPFVRIGCLLSGGIFILSLLGCRGCLSVAHTYVSFAFIIIGLSSHVSGKMLFKLQIVILYFGASINKMTVSGWWNGGYFEAMMFGRYQHEFYMSIAELFPQGLASTFMGIFVLFIEFALVVLLLRRRWYIFGIILGLFFHTSITFMMGSTFGPFWYAMLISYIAFVEFPKQVRVSLPDHILTDWVKRLLAWVDTNDYFVIIKEQGKLLSITFNNFTFRGLFAILVLAFTSVIPYYLILRLASDRRIRNDVTIVVFILLSMILANVVWQRLQQRKLSVSQAS